MLRHNGEPLELLERWFVVRMDAMAIDHQGSAPEEWEEPKLPHRTPKSAGKPLLNICSPNARTSERLCLRGSQDVIMFQTQISWYLISEQTGPVRPVFL